MKILIVTETLYEGGAELFALRLTRKLRQMNIDAEILCLNKIHENKALTTLYNDVPIHRLHLPFQRLIEKIDSQLLRLRIDHSIKYWWHKRIIRRDFVDNYDIIHTNHIQADFLIAELKKNKRFRHVVTVHGDYSAHWNNELLKTNRVWLDLLPKLDVLKENVDRWVVISEEQKLFFLKKMKLADDRVLKIYNGFEPAVGLVPTRKQEIFTIGMVSRGEPKKGWQTLIDAFLKMPGNCRLVLVGDSDYLQKLREKYKSQSTIIFAGFHPNPVEWINRFDVMVLPTEFPYESLPTVIIEALYCHTPVIATDVGEIRSMITDTTTGERAGLLLDLQQGKISVEQLHQYLLYCYEHDSELSKMSEIAAKLFKNFDMTDCAGHYVAVYRDLLGD